MLEGATWGVQDWVQVEQKDLRHMTLLESVGGVLWGSWTKVRLVNLN